MTFIAYIFLFFPSSLLWILAKRTLTLDSILDLLCFGLLSHEADNTKATFTKNFHDFIPGGNDVISFQRVSSTCFHDPGLSEMVTLILCPSLTCFVFLYWRQACILEYYTFELSTTY